jgi:hypothetical protein
LKCDASVLACDFLPLGFANGSGWIEDLGGATDLQAVQHGEPRIVLLVVASARTLVEVCTAARAQPFAAFGAERAFGQGE